MIQARQLAALLALTVVAGASVAQQLYRWTDAKGRVHITDTPPPPNARSVQQARQIPAAPDTSQTTQTPFELAQAMKNFPVQLYTSPMCKEPCSRARDALNRRGVPFKESPVYDDATNEELKRVSGGNEVPVLVVGRSVHKGFEQGAYDALLDSARYPRAGVLPARAQAAPKLPEGYAVPGDASAPKAEPVKPPEEPKPAGPYAPGAPPQRSPQGK